MVKSNKSSFGVEKYKFSKEALSAKRIPFMPDIGSCGCSSIDEYGGMNREDIGTKLGGPLQLAWTVSRRCNFKCPHCFNNSGPDFDGYEAPREVIIDNIIEAAPFNVCLCGGEPLTFPDLGKISKKLRDGGIPFVSIVTNAYLATEDRLHRAADDGVNQFQISVDGPSPEDHAWYRSAENSWERAIRAITDALKIKNIDSVAVSMLPNRYNIESFPDYVRMMIGLGVHSVRAQPLMPIGRGADTFDKLAPSAEQYLILQRMINELQDEFSFKEYAVIEWGDPLEHIWFYSATEAVPHHASIQVNGWLELTPYFPVMFCDLTKHSLKDLWKKPIRDMWKIPIILNMADTLQTLDGMSRLSPRIYFEDPILIDCFDEENWALAQETSEIEVLIDYARRKGLYNIEVN